MYFEKRMFAFYWTELFCICENGGVVPYTQSLNYKGLRFYGHFKLFPMLSYYAVFTDGHILITSIRF